MSCKFTSYFLALFLCASAFTNEREEQLVEHVKRCITLAEQRSSRLVSPASNIDGMTGQKIRHFLNNLCSLPNTSYLEIGCWRGATLVAALYGNAATVDYAIGVDNWSEFGGPRRDCLENISRFLSNVPIRFVEKDCFNIDKTTCFPSPVNIYFYDGNHSAKNQACAFTYFNDIFEDVFIALVDDWNGDWIREGTRAGFAELNYEILFEQSIFTNCNGDPNGWWNGFYIAVLKKPSA